MNYTSTHQKKAVFLILVCIFHFGSIYTVYAYPSVDDVGAFVQMGHIIGEYVAGIGMKESFVLIELAIGHLDEFPESLVPKSNVPRMSQERVGEKGEDNMGITYIVQAGDTLGGIARRFQTSIYKLMEVNDIKNKNLIYTGQKLYIPPPDEEFVIPITHSERELLERVVEAEAGGEPYLGKVAVAAVIVNRVLSPLFPDNVYDVIHEPRQFTPIITGKAYRVIPSEETKAAVSAALKGVDPTRGSLYFYNPKIAREDWARWHQQRTQLIVIGEHHFSR